MKPEAGSGRVPGGAGRLEAQKRGQPPFVSRAGASAPTASETSPPTARSKKELRREERVEPAPQPVSLGAIGMESEFTVLFDGRSVKPEDVFGSPTNIVRAPMIHRTGRSYHLPSGGAVYFDTGVIEIATGMIEIEKGCASSFRGSARITTSPSVPSRRSGAERIGRSASWRFC
jgi:hypothetical protein